MADKTTLNTLDTANKNNDATASQYSKVADGLLPQERSPATETMGMQDSAPVPLAKATNATKPTKSKAAGSSKNAKHKATGSSKTSRNPTCKETLDKKEQVKQLEQDIQNILLWQQPFRSAAFFVLTISGLLLSKSYSVVEIVSALMTIVIAINLLYVTFTVQSQRILANNPGSNPYSVLLQNKEVTTMDRNALQRNTELIADVIEAVLQKIWRIVLIEDTTYSVKCLMIFYIVWKLSAIISVRTLVTLFAFVLFSVPLLYKYNQKFVDARILQAQSVCQTQLEHGQNKLQQGWHQLCTRFKLQETEQDSSAASGTLRSRKEI